MQLPRADSSLVRPTRAAVVAALLGLVVLGLAWELWLAPTGARSLALKVLPLTLPLTGVLKLRLSSYRVLSLLVWLYVAEGSFRAVADAGVSARLAWIELALCAVLFTACVLHIRSRMPAPAAAVA